MGFLKSIFKNLEAEISSEKTANPVIREIAATLRELDSDRAEYLAAFAFILGRVANADLDISDEEIESMTQILQKVGNISLSQAEIVVKIVKNLNQLKGATESYLVTREFSELATKEEKIQLLDCLFAVSAADDSISGEEEKELKQICSELKLSDYELIKLRSKYRDKREILKSFKPEE